MWPNLCVGKHCHHTSEQAILFLLEILEKTVINMFMKVFADGKLMMAWLYINKRETFFLWSHDRFINRALLFFSPFVCIHAYENNYVLLNA